MLEKTVFFLCPHGTFRKNCIGNTFIAWSHDVYEDLITTMLDGNRREMQLDMKTSNQKQGGRGFQK